MRRRRWSTLVGAFASLSLVTLLSSSCSDGYPPSVGGDGVSPSPASGSQCPGTKPGCPCDEPGKVADCGQVHRTSDNYVTCSTGTMTCSSSRTWGECMGDRLFVQSLQPMGLTPQALGVAGACVSNPCDPYCSQMEDSPSPPFDAGTGLTMDDAGMKLVGSSADAAVPAVIEVYGHTRSNLYSVNPVTYTATNRGPFKTGATFTTNITDMTDIALDKNGEMWGVTFSKLYKIDYESTPGTIKCTFLANLATSFNGLTFIPAGMGLDPVNETLIGIANNGGWWRVNLSASPVTLTKLGNYPAGYTSSGDGVGIIGDAVYATVNKTGSANVRVVKVNPVNGGIITDLGMTTVPTGTGLFGVGYWGGKMFGFAGDGKFYTINLTNGATTYVSKPTTEWWGAGVTTSAPVVPPTYSGATFTRDYASDCIPGESPVWHFFDWKTSTPSDSKIIISVQTADTVAGLASATSVPLATITGPDITTWTGVDVEAKLKAAGQKSRVYLRVTIQLVPSTGGSQTPVLVAWRQQYDCNPTE